MEFFHKVIFEVGATLVSTIISVAVCIKFIIPKLIKEETNSMPNMFPFFGDMDEEEDDEDKPTIFATSTREGPEDSGPEGYEQMNKLMENFLSKGEKILYEYKDYGSHKEIVMGPRIQAGKD